MRIVMVTPYAPLRDGLADYAAFLSAELRARGHGVHVVASRGAQDPPREVIATVPRSPLNVADVWGAIAAREPDVVHVQFCVAAFATTVPALLRLIECVRSAGIRVVITFHDLSRDVAKLGIIGRALYRRLAATSDAVIVHTDTAGRLLAEITTQGRTEATVIPYPPTPLPSATKTAPELAYQFGLTEKRALLAFGFLYVDKGLDDLVSAVHLLRQARGHRVDDVRVAVAGAVRARRGPFRIFELRDRVHVLRVRALISRLGLRDVIVFAGYVPEGEVGAWFELADAAVLPYRRIEQSSVASLARSAGTPIVASDVGELAAFVQRPEWLCPPGSPSELAAALASCLDSGRRASGCAANDGSELSDAVTATLGVYAAPQPAGT